MMIATRPAPLGDPGKVLADGECDRRELQNALLSSTLPIARAFAWPSSVSHRRACLPCSRAIASKGAGRLELSEARTPRAKFRVWRGVQGVPEPGVLRHAVAVASNRHDVAMMDESIDERRGHHLVAEDLAPLFKALGRTRSDIAVDGDVQALRRTPRQAYSRKKKKEDQRDVR